MPSSLRIIDFGAFEYCSQLSTVSLNHGLTQLGDFAFAYCKKLTNITIPSTVKTMGGYIVYGGYGRPTIYVKELTSKPKGWDPYWRTLTANGHASVLWGQ